MLSCNMGDKGSRRSRAKVLNPYSMSYADDEDLKGGSLPLSPHQRKVVAVFIFLASFTIICFSRVSSRASNEDLSNTYDPMNPALAMLTHQRIREDVSPSPRVVLPPAPMARFQQEEEEIEEDSKTTAAEVNEDSVPDLQNESSGSLRGSVVAARLEQEEDTAKEREEPEEDEEEQSADSKIMETSAAAAVTSINGNGASSVATSSLLANKEVKEPEGLKEEANDFLPMEDAKGLSLSEGNHVSSVGSDAGVGQSKLSDAIQATLAEKGGDEEVSAAEKEVEKEEKVEDSAVGDQGLKMKEVAMKDEKAKPSADGSEVEKQEDLAAEEQELETKEGKGHLTAEELQKEEMKEGQELKKGEEKRSMVVTDEKKNADLAADEDEKEKKGSITPTDKELKRTKEAEALTEEERDGVETASSLSAEVQKEMNIMKQKGTGKQKTTRNEESQAVESKREVSSGSSQVSEEEEADVADPDKAVENAENEEPETSQEKEAEEESIAGYKAPTESSSSSKVNLVHASKLKKSQKKGQEDQQIKKSRDWPEQKESKAKASDAVLPSGLTDKVLIWLRADEGVDVSKNGHDVLAWHSLIDSTSESVHFRALNDWQSKMAQETWKKTLTVDANVTSKEGRRTVPEDLIKLPQLVTDDDFAALSFPSPLTAKGVQLQDQATIFIVLSPPFLEKGDQAPGQRFFGHYPQGQLRFHDGQLGFKTEAGDYLLKGQVKENQWMIAAYRFEGNVQMSLNGEGFEVVTSESGEEDNVAPIFSGEQGFLTLGGVDADAGFLGKIAEVLIVKESLTDGDVFEVSQYLGVKYGIPVPSMSSGSSSSSSNSKVGRSQGKTSAAAEDASKSVEGEEQPQLSKEELALEKETEMIEKLETQLDAQCQHGSPFKGTVEEFSVPEAATLVDTQKWEEAVAASKLRIKGFKGGGGVLRGYINKEVKLLERLRHALFCKYVKEGGEQEEVQESVEQVGKELETQEKEVGGSRLSQSKSKGGKGIVAEKRKRDRKMKSSPMKP